MLIIYRISKYGFILEFTYPFINDTYPERGNFCGLPQRYTMKYFVI